MSEFSIDNQVYVGRNLAAGGFQAKNIPYTISFLFRGNGIVKAGGKSWTLGSQDWSVFQERFTPDYDSAVEIPGTLEVKEVKLEEGIRKTPWTEPLEEGTTLWIQENLIETDTLEWSPWYSPSPNIIPPVFKNIGEYEAQMIYSFQAEVEFRGVQGGGKFYFGFTPVSFGISEVPGDGVQIIYGRWMATKNETGTNLGVMCRDWLEGEFRIRKVLLKKDITPASPNYLQDSQLLRIGWNYGLVLDDKMEFVKEAYREFTAAHLENNGGSTGYILSQKVSVTPGKPQTLSFFYRGTGLEVYLGPDVSWEILGNSPWVEVENYKSPEVSFKISKPERTWRRHWITFMSLGLKEICRDVVVLRFKVPGDKESWVFGPKLEDGDKPSEWTVMSNSLTKDSGITNPIWCKQN